METVDPALLAQAHWYMRQNLRRALVYGGALTDRQCNSLDDDEVESCFMAVSDEPRPSDTTGKGGT